MRIHIIFFAVCWFASFVFSPGLLLAQEPDAAVSRPSVSRVQAPALRFDHLSVEDGLSHTSVYAVMQDPPGVPVVRHGRRLE